MLRAALVALGVGVALPAGAAPTQMPILGGTPTEPGEFPTVVAVEIRFGGGGAAICTGTLIHPEWVLTAAHCIQASELGVSTQEQATAMIDVRLDATEAFAGGIVAQPIATFPHPGFRRNDLGDDDIGLIRIPPVDRMVQRINAHAADAPIGVEVTFVGYGETEAGTSGRAYVLDGRTSTACAAFGASDETLLCFDQTDGRGQCFGDSGGPTFAMVGGVSTQVGVTSFGDQSCSFFGAETRVDAEHDFLEQIIGVHALRCVHDGMCAAGCPGLYHDEDCEACTRDADCAEGEVCDFAGSCLPEPYATGGLGSACLADAECATGRCLDAGEGGQCTSDCNDDDQCPAGFACIAGPTAQDVCWPSPESGGCAAGGGAGGLVALGLVGLALTPRRRRRARGAATGSRA